MCIKSETPRRKHLFSISTSFSLLMISTGILFCHPFFLIAARTPKPSMPGICRSRSRAAVSSKCRFSFFSASSPSCAVSTIYSSASISRSISRFTSASSTTNILFCIVIPLIFPLSQYKLILAQNPLCYYAQITFLSFITIYSGRIFKIAYYVCQ